MSEQKYWQWPVGSTVVENGAIFGLRAALAWKLLDRLMVAAYDPQGPEDKEGNAHYRFMTVQEMVDRCFATADAFIAQAEARGEIQAVGLQEMLMDKNLFEVRLKAAMEGYGMEPPK